MRKPWKTVIIYCILLTLTAILLSACSKSKETKEASNTPAATSGASNTATASSTETAPPDPLLTTGKYETPITMTTYGCTGSAMTFKKGETLEDNVVRKIEHDKLGIDVKYVWTTTDANDGCRTKMRLDLSSGAKLPDVINVDVRDPIGLSLLADYAATNQFIDISEVFEKYASPSLKRIMSENEDTWSVGTIGGKRLGLPVLDDATVNDGILWIRQDWLDKLGLQAPKTIQELEALMDAFVNQDPDGDGKKDTYGLALAWKPPGKPGAFSRDFSDGSFVFGALTGTIPATWVSSPDGGLEYSSLRPEMKQGLLKLKEWLDKGYIDKQAGSYDGVKASESVTAGKTGIVSGPWWFNSWPLNDLAELKKTNPNAQMRAYPLPGGADGKKAFYSAKSLRSALLINKNYEHPEALILYMNMYLDIYLKQNGWPYGMAEGYDYVLDEKGDIAEHTDNANSFYVPNYAIMGLPTDPYAYIKALDQVFKDPKSATTPFLKWAAANKLILPAAPAVVGQMQYAVKDKFMAAPGPAMKANSAMLVTLEDTTFTEIVYGKKPIEAFDAFVQKWKSSGGDEITKEVNEWYKSSRKQ